MSRRRTHRNSGDFAGKQMSFDAEFLNGGVRKGRVGSVLPDSTNEPTPQTTILSIDALRRLATTIGRIKYAIDQATQRPAEPVRSDREIGRKDLAGEKVEVNDDA